MLLPTSAEFVELCRSQLWLLVQGLGASAAMVYLTEEVVNSAETRLVRVASVPEGTVLSDQSLPLALPANLEMDAELPNPLLPHPVTSSRSETIGLLADAGSRSAVPELGPLERLVLPLMHEEMVLGLLVAERRDRSWDGRERQQIERTIQTLSLACVLDQRSRWLQHRQQQTQQLQLQQHDLMDNLVHQFRNPLTALRTFGKLLLKRLPEDDRNREAAASIVRESDRLQELLLQIDRAIDLHETLPNEPRATAPAALPAAGTLGVRLELQPCDVREILQPLLISAAAVAQEKQQVLHTEWPERLPTVQANASALREVLSNLVDNAVKYTPIGGEVHVRVTANPDKVQVSVTDNGGGIPDGDLAQLFQRHFRGVQAQTETPGTGLGLAIARELVQQMQGEIQVFSPLLPDGWLSEVLPTTRGVTFVLTLTPWVSAVAQPTG
jgi:signal transduction histidine kinase